jgi:hypothetical protein
MRTRNLKENGAWIPSKLMKESEKIFTVLFIQIRIQRGQEFGSTQAKKVHKKGNIE